jgi:DNA polymerase (family X)
MNNHQLAAIFTRIADLLEIKGEVVFKTRAYRRAAESLASLGTEASELVQAGTIQEVPGIGKAIAEKIEELLDTGKLNFLERLLDQVPETLIDLLRVPDMGPKKVSLVWQQAGVTNLAELEAAARAGKLRTLSGMGEKSEAKILAGIEALQRRTGRIPLGDAWPFAQVLVVELQTIPGVQAVQPAGSLRRMKATIGDLDILVAASQSQAVMDAFTQHPRVVQVISKGETKASVEFDNGLRAQLWAHPPERFGTALQYATGSKEHNVRLREIALAQGLSLSEHALTQEDGTEILCADEQQLYKRLGLPWIPPELREDRGEIKAAKSGTLPQNLELKQILAELHAHTDWSDGQLSIRELVEVALERGYQVIAITDHSQGLGIVGGISPEKVPEQAAEIQAMRDEFGDRIRILHGVEVEIKADGSLDYPDEVLQRLDIVIASLHVSLRQPREKVTERLISAISNPHVDIIGHPTGRLLPDREGADLDMDAIFKAAAVTGVAMEINANPYRLDLDDVYARRVVKLGIPITINTDAHAPGDFDYLHFGVATARRGWVEPDNVINTWKPERLIHWLKARETKNAN